MEALASKVTAEPTVAVLSAPAFATGGAVSVEVEPEAEVIVNFGLMAVFECSEL